MSDEKLSPSQLMAIGYAENVKIAAPNASSKTTPEIIAEAEKLNVISPQMRMSIGYQIEKEKAENLKNEGENQNDEK